MRFKLGIFALILVLSGGYVYWDMIRTPPSVSPKTSEILESRAMSPNPSFTDLGGRRHALHDFKGRVIILNFWATWCAPCVAEFPQLLELAGAEKDKIVLIAISVDEEKENIQRFLRKHKFSIHTENVVIAHDPEKTISQDIFQTRIYPETFIIAPDMHIAEKITGAADWGGDDIKARIDRLATLQ